MNRHCMTLMALAMTASGPSLAQELGNPDCDHLMLVSSYSANNVKIYDACDYSYLGDLDQDNHIVGPQAIAIDPEGGLVVVSETNGRLIRYHRKDLSYDRTVAGDQPETGPFEPTPVQNPTGLVIAPDGRLFVGSYSDHTVVELDPDTGSVVRTIVTNADSGILGSDTGMWLDGDRLIVPGFDSSSVVEANINRAGTSRVLVSAGSGGLNAPRTVLQRANGNLLVTSWRGGQIMEYDGNDGSFIRVVSDAIPRPTGMTFESEDVLLVASDSINAVFRVRISTGESLGRILSFADGELQGPTFILLLEKRRTLVSQNRSFWLLGVGNADMDSIAVDAMILTTGGVFGNDFDPGAIGEHPWGTLDIEFDGCNSGMVNWASEQAGFGAGSYPIIRISGDPNGADCDAAGFGNTVDGRWMTGLWYGGAERAGEGFAINRLDGGLAVVTWYTVRPAGE